MTLKIEIAQINFIVGDLEGNTEKIIKAWRASENKGSDLIMFSELSLTGYPPEDLLHKKYFIRAVEEKILLISDLTKQSKTAILLGAPASYTDKYGQNLLYNAAFLIDQGEVSHIIRKTNLPNYGVFDERRYFATAQHLSVIDFRGLQLAILICEDVWHLKNAYLLAEQKLDAILVINASPFHFYKAKERLAATRKFIQHIKKPLFYLNQIGGQDGVIFDGSSFVLDEEGEILLTLPAFKEGCAVIAISTNGIECNDYVFCDETTQCYGQKFLEHSEEELIYNALILGLRDYILKNGFSKILIGMSGGIDSALAAVIAADAVGSDKIKLVALPSRYNSQMSLDDARKCSENLDVKLEEISIESTFEALNNSLALQFVDTQPDLTEENIQSRIRAVILMALSNKFGHLLITTGNKSEMAVGYATIYGDMCGAFNPLKDVYKTQIYNLAKWRNDKVPELSLYQKTNLIPQNIIYKAPSAELRFNQKDSDSLPEYDVLDKILFALIEEEKSLVEIIKMGFEEALVKKIAKLFYNSEYKRRQAVIGAKVSKMSFDRDRRYPITNKFTI